MSTATMDEMVAGVRAHSMKNYERDGWDYVVECFEDSEIIEEITTAKATTVAEAIRAVGSLAKLLGERRQDVRAEIF